MLNWKWTNHYIIPRYGQTDANRFNTFQTLPTMSKAQWGTTINWCIEAARAQKTFHHLDHVSKSCTEGAQKPSHNSWTHWLGSYWMIWKKTSFSTKNVWGLIFNGFTKFWASQKDLAYIPNGLREWIMISIFSIADKTKFFIISGPAEKLNPHSDTSKSPFWPGFFSSPFSQNDEIRKSKHIQAMWDGSSIFQVHSQVPRLSSLTQLRITNSKNLHKQNMNA